MGLIGAKVKNIREMKNLSQEYVAESIGISQTAYSKIENNQTRLTADRISKLANLFEVPEHEFFNIDQKIEFNGNTINNAYVNNLFESQKDTYEHTIKTLENQIEILNKEKKDLHNILIKNK